LKLEKGVLALGGKLFSTFKLYCMPILIKNSDPSISLCNEAASETVQNVNTVTPGSAGKTKGTVRTKSANKPKAVKFFRKHTVVNSIISVKKDITDFKNELAKLPANSPFSKLNLVMSVPIEDIKKIINSEPDAKYLKVYNAFSLQDPAKRHTMYLVPANNGNIPYNNIKTMFAQDCCQCPNPPCPRTDKLTN
jgi:hypothetical protein